MSEQAKLQRRTLVAQLRHYAARLQAWRDGMDNGAAPSVVELAAAALGVERVADELELRQAAWADGTDNVPTHHFCPHCGGQIVLLYPGDDIDAAHTALDKATEALAAAGDAIEAYAEHVSSLVTKVWPHDPATLRPGEDGAVAVEGGD